MADEAMNEQELHEWQHVIGKLSTAVMDDLLAWAAKEDIEPSMALAVVHTATAKFAAGAIGEFNSGNLDALVRAEVVDFSLSLRKVIEQQFPAQLSADFKRETARLDRITKRGRGLARPGGEA